MFLWLIYLINLINLIIFFYHKNVIDWQSWFWFRHTAKPKPIFKVLKQNFPSSTMINWRSTVDLSTRPLMSLICVLPCRDAPHWHCSPGVPSPTSVCPSLAAEISAVQQSWDKWGNKHPRLITQTSSSQEELKILCLWSFRSYQLVIPGGHSEGSSTVTRKVLYYTIYLLVWEAPTVCACKPRHLVISKNDRTEYQLFWFYALPTPMKSHIWLKNCSLPKQTEILKSTTGIIKTLKTTKIKVIDSKKS